MDIPALQLIALVTLGACLLEWEGMGKSPPPLLKPWAYPPYNCSHSPWPSFNTSPLIFAETHSPETLEIPSCQKLILWLTSPRNS